MPGNDGQSDAVEQEISRFINDLLTEQCAMPEGNALLWWTIIIVRSSLDMVPNDFISSGRFHLLIYLRNTLTELNTSWTR